MFTMDHLRIGWKNSYMGSGEPRRFIELSSMKVDLYTFYSTWDLGSQEDLLNYLWRLIFIRFTADGSECISSDMENNDVMPRWWICILIWWRTVVDMFSSFDSQNFSTFSLRLTIYSRDCNICSLISLQTAFCLVVVEERKKGEKKKSWLSTKNCRLKTRTTRFLENMLSRGSKFVNDR